MALFALVTALLLFFTWLETLISAELALCESDWMADFIETCAVSLENTNLASFFAAAELELSDLACTLIAAILAV